MSRTEWDAVLTLPVDQERDHVQGAVSAAVTLVQYGDYECPYCGQAYPIIKDMQARVGDRLRFVFRNFPISTSHPHAEHAAEAAEAADAQGEFWRMHDLLYERQRHLADGSPCVRGGARTRRGTLRQGDGRARARRARL